MAPTFIIAQLVNLIFPNFIFKYFCSKYFFLKNKVKKPTSCEDLFYNFNVNTNSEQIIYPDDPDTPVNIYCTNGMLTCGTKVA